MQTQDYLIWLISLERDVKIWKAFARQFNIQFASGVSIKPKHILNLIDFKKLGKF